MADLENVIRMEGLPTKNAYNWSSYLSSDSPIAGNLLLSGNILLSVEEGGILHCLSNVLFLIISLHFCFYPSGLYFSLSMMLSWPDTNSVAPYSLCPKSSLPTQEDACVHCGSFPVLGGQALWSTVEHSPGLCPPIEDLGWSK